MSIFFFLTRLYAPGSRRLRKKAEVVTGNHFIPDVCLWSIEQVLGSSKQTRHTQTEAKSVKAPEVQCHHATEIMLHLQHRSFFDTHFNFGYCFGLV